MRKIWPGTQSRRATETEVRSARRALRELENERLQIILVPAPDPHFSGHCIRVIASTNPRWYRGFVAGRWDRRGCQVKRRRVERALRRVADDAFVRGNGYEVRILKLLDGWWD